MRLAADELVWKREGTRPYYLYDKYQQLIAAIYDDGEILHYTHPQKGDVTKHMVDSIPTDPKELEEFLEYWKTIIIMQWEG